MSTKPYRKIKMTDISQSNYLRALDWMLPRIGCGPFNGGCLLYAQALKQVLGGEIWVLEGGRIGRPHFAQHAFLKTKDGNFHDASGSGAPQWMVRRFYNEEIPLKHIYTVGDLRHLSDGDLPHTPYSKEHVQELSSHLQSIFQSETIA